MEDKIEIRKGDKFQYSGCGEVIFQGFDYYMGQKTAQLYSEKYRQTFHPFPEKVEEQGYILIN